MNLVFCGTPQFAVPTLQAVLTAGHRVARVLSQPDRPVGRDARVAPTPVKAAALAHGIPVEQPEKIRANPALAAMLAADAPDAIVVVAYGRILPRWMLDLPRLGCVNGHASLLPRWRGAAPIQWAIAAGDAETGVTTMQMDQGMDTGAMLLRRPLPITGETTAPELFVSLADVTAGLMVETLDGLQAGSIVPQVQVEAEATRAPMLLRDDGRIDWSNTAARIEARFRAFQPWPGAFTQLRGRKLIVHAMRRDSEAGNNPVGNGSPGEIQAVADAVRVCCGSGTSLLLDEVQMEGKRRMSAPEFLRGFPFHAGERFG